MMQTNETREYVGEYLLRLTKTTVKNEINLQHLFKNLDFWGHIQRKEKFLGDEYLGLLFNFQNLNINDFKIFNKDELYAYIDTYMQEDVNDLGIEELNIISLFIQKAKFAMNDNVDYFVLNKIWFDSNSVKIFQREYFCYPMYIFIIWFVGSNIFTCELSWD